MTEFGLPSLPVFGPAMVDAPKVTFFSRWQSANMLLPPR